MGVTDGPMREPSRLRTIPLAAAVAAAGAAVTSAAASHIYFSWSGPSVVGAIVALLVAATLAEAYPVPVDAVPAGHVSLAAVFVVGAAVVYGWAEAALIAYGARTAIELLQRRPAAQLIYNGPVYALAGAAGALAATSASTGSSAAAVALSVGASSAAFYAVNLVLVTAMSSLAAARSFWPLLSMAAVHTFVPFSIIASSALMLVVLWERDPLLSLALVGPLLAIALYQRSVHGALVATRLALTDSLTGLGNQRQFRERLEQELDACAASARPLALCILDVDGLKRVNDTFGHPVGDALLERVAACLRHGGEGFRVGGDEFALLLPNRSAETAHEIALAVVARVAEVEVTPGARIGVRVSAGVAAYPTHCRERNDLYRCADQALYRAKRGGGNGVSVYTPPQPPDVHSIPA